MSNACLSAELYWCAAPEGDHASGYEVQVAEINALTGQQPWRAIFTSKRGGGRGDSTSVSITVGKLCGPRNLRQLRARTLAKQARGSSICEMPRDAKRC